MVVWPGFDPILLSHESLVAVYLKLMLMMGILDNCVAISPCVYLISSAGLHVPDAFSYVQEHL